ncbi:MAG: flagellar hook-basal body complex protein FliE [Candidatus Caenarcaniphilales bacterium]|nr:flagellar hook-basal body complex protein FliE [Candidatus Caenarcaniphilales bacterium]
MTTFPGFPSYPGYPEMPKLPSFPGSPTMPNTPNLPGASGQPNSLAGTFSNMLSKVSGEINEPNQMARDMVSGKRPYDSTELMISMMEAEHKLNVTIRTMNELVKGIKQLENLQI